MELRESSPAACSVHDVEFMATKYRADLLYSQNNPRESASLYRKLLDLVPPENSCVVKELRDSLARSLLKLGDGESAKREAEQLVRESER